MTHMFLAALVVLAAGAIPPEAQQKIQEALPASAPAAEATPSRRDISTA